MSQQDWLPPAVRASGVERRLKAGQALFRMGQSPVGLYELVSGSVRLVRVASSGQEAVLFTAGAGDTIAEASLFSSSYHCDAIATTNSVVRLYSKPAIIAAFERDPKASQAFMAVLARRIMNLRTRLEQRNIHSARDRVRHFLTVNAGADGRTVVLPGTVKDLAADLGLSHEALYRTLSEMAAEGEIERLKGRIRLTS